MPRSNEDEAWRAIVENYGDRAEIDPTETPDEPLVGIAGPSVTSTPPDGDRFVPPPPPPLPHIPRDRLFAWIGLFGSPAVLLAALIFGVSMPPLIGYLLVAGFIGGFLYLVVQMPRGPADPWDDGARL